MILPKFPEVDDRAVYDDKAYACGWKRTSAKKGVVLWAVKEKAQAGRPLARSQCAFNKKHGSVRAKVGATQAKKKLRQNRSEPAAPETTSR